MPGIQKNLVPLFGLGTVVITNTADLSDDTYSNALGAHASTVFMYRVTAIGVGDTWTIEALWAPLTSTQYIVVAASGDITATTTFVELTLQAPFTSANYAIPMPLQLVTTNTVAGASPTLTFQVCMAHGD